MDATDTGGGGANPEATPRADPLAVLDLMKAATFLAKLSGRLNSSSSQLLDNLLEGASRLRPVLRVITNMLMVASQW